jgi:predicted aldo/keto reductase-like oxidoreductase
VDYRELGKTGLMASVVGLGAEHLVGKPYEQVKEVVDACLDGGVNIMDVFMPQEEVREHLGKALGGRRDKMMLQGHIGSVMKGDQADISRDLAVCKKHFEHYLTAFGTDYIDIGMLFYIDSEDDYKGTFEGGLADYAVELKKKGVIRAIGASSHNPVMASRAIETGIIDVMMFSINPAFDMYPGDGNVFDFFEGEKADTSGFLGIHPDRANFYKLCLQRNVGITVMKTLGAGKLLSAEHTPFSRPLTVGQCIHYALTRPAVASTLVGMISAEQVREALKYPTLSEAERDYSDAISIYQKDFTGNCVYCNHCQPCPAEIDVAALTKFLDIARLDTGNIPASIRQHYSALAHKGSECIGCGSCEERCPFSVKVIDNMAKAAELFGE